MRASHAAGSRGSWLSHRSKFLSLKFLTGLVVSILSCALLWLNARPLLADVLAQLLSGAQIEVTQSLSAEGPKLVLKLLDGSSLDVTLTWQRSGFVSALIFALLFVFLMLPIGGAMRLKMLWLELGFLIGLTWSLIRLLLAVFTSYYFGVGAFVLAEFFTGPLTDFVWMVSIWSLCLSTSVPVRHRAAW